MRKTLIGFFLLFIALSCDKEEKLYKTGSEEGFVTSYVTGLPIKGAIVSCGKKEAETNAEGKYELLDIPLGIQKIKVTKAGYETKVAEYRVLGGEPRATYYSLQPATDIEIENMEYIPDSSRFEITFIETKNPHLGFLSEIRTNVFYDEKEQMNYSYKDVNNYENLNYYLSDRKEVLSDTQIKYKFFHYISKSSLFGDLGNPNEMYLQCFLSIVYMSSEYNYDLKKFEPIDNISEGSVIYKVTAND